MSTLPLRPQSWAAVFFLGLFLTTGSWTGAAPKTALPPPAPDGYDTRFGIAPGTELKKLINNPSIVQTENYQYKENNETRMTGFTDAHAVFDTPLDFFVQTLNDVAYYPKYVPRVLTATILKEPLGEGDTSRARYSSGINFLGFVIAYDTIEEGVYQRPSPTIAQFKSRLVESLDGQLYEHYSSFYIETVIVDGKPMTYARTYNRPGVRNPFPGMLTVSSLFAAGEGKNQLWAVAKEAARRAQVNKP